MRGWKGRPGCQHEIGVRGTGSKSSRDSTEGRIIRGMAQARTTQESWVLPQTSKESQDGTTRQGRETIFKSETRFWPRFMEHLIGTTFVLLLRKQTVMQDTEERGEGGISRKSNYKTIRCKRPKTITFKMRPLMFKKIHSTEQNTTSRTFFSSRTKRRT